MFTRVRAFWSKVSTPVLFSAALGLGGYMAYDYFDGDCCAPGASCCYVGSPCCKGNHLAEK